MKALMLAIKGALDNYETPDSPEGMDAAMRLLRSEYELAEIRADMIRRKQSEAGKTTKRRLTKKDARAMAKTRWAAGVALKPCEHDGARSTTHRICED
jgi:hypothetical protein